MGIQSLQLSFTTSDGQIFTDRKKANAHQARLVAIKQFADGLSEKFDLDPVVGVNIAAYLAEQPETLCRLIGRAYRRTPEEIAASGGDVPASDDAAAGEQPPQAEQPAE